MSLYVILVEKGVINLVRTQLATGGGGVGVYGSHPKCTVLHTWSVTSHLYVCTYTISSSLLLCIGRMFDLKGIVLIAEN